MKQLNEVLTITEKMLLQKQNYLNYHRYNHLKEKIKNNVKSIFDSYLRIGAYLREIKNKKLYLLQDYKNIYEFAAEEFELSETTTKNLININLRFCNDLDQNKYEREILEKYKVFSYSQLVELLSVSDDSSLIYLPSMSVKEIREIKKFEAIDADIKDFITTFVNIFFEIDKVYLKPFKYAIREYSWGSNFDLKNFDFKSEDNFYLVFYMNESYYLTFELFSDKEKENIINLVYANIDGYCIKLEKNTIKTIDDFRSVCKSYVNELKKECSDEEFSIPKPIIKTKAEREAEKKEKEKQLEEKIRADNTVFGIASSAIEYKNDLLKLNRALHLDLNIIGYKEILILRNNIRYYSDQDKKILKNTTNNMYSIELISSDEGSYLSDNAYLVDEKGKKVELSFAFLLSYFIDDVLSDYSSYSSKQYFEEYYELKGKMHNEYYK